MVYFPLFLLILFYPSSYFFFFNDTATTEIYTLSLHDALPIYFGSTKSHMGRTLSSWGKGLDPPGSPRRLKAPSPGIKAMISNQSVFEMFYSWAITVPSVN